MSADAVVAYLNLLGEQVIPALREITPVAYTGADGVYTGQRGPT
jgi:hypothetical protein